MSDLTAESGISFALIGAVLLIAVFVPLSASFLLDGVLLAVRGRGMRPLAALVGVTLVTAFVSYGVWKFGLIGVESNPALQVFANGMRSAIKTLLPWTVPLALIAFVFRTVNGWVK